LTVDLSERFRRPPRTSFLEEHGLSTSAVEAVESDETPPGGIYGVGATSDARGNVVPILYVIEELIDWSDSTAVPSSIWDQHVAATVASRYSHNLPKTLLVSGLPRPEEYGVLNTGDEIVCEGARGTCGIKVRQGVNDSLVLTAGHVAKRVNAPVASGGNHVGTVIFSDYLGRHSSDEIVADVAVVDVESSTTIASKRTGTEPAVGKQLDPVVIDGRSGPIDGWIRSVVPSFALRANAGCWGEVLLTDRAISQPGDSGSPADLDDGSNTVLGHVVGGFYPAYTLIQDLSYVMAAAGVSFL